MVLFIVKTVGCNHLHLFVHSDTCLAFKTQGFRLTVGFMRAYGETAKNIDEAGFSCFNASVYVTFDAECYILLLPICEASVIC